VQAVLIPDNILAFLAGHQDVERPVPIHVDETDFIGRLVLMNTMFGEVARAVVFDGASSWEIESRKPSSPHLLAW